MAYLRISKPMFQDPEVLAIIKEIFPNVDTTSGIMCPDNAFYLVESEALETEQTISIGLSSYIAYIPKGYEYTSHTYKGSKCFAWVIKENAQQCLNTAKRNVKYSKAERC